MKTEFEKLAELHGLDLNKNAFNYLNPKTTLAEIFYNARQAEIDKLKHDLASADCANRIYEHILDKQLKKEEVKL